MFTRTFQSIVSNKAATSPLLKKPLSLIPKAIFFPSQVKTSLNHPVARFGFCQSFKPENQSAEQAKKMEEDLSKVSTQFEALKNKETIDLDSAKR